MSNSESINKNYGDKKENSADQAKVSLPSISMPKGGGAIRGIGEKFAANPVTGTGTMNIPIYTSPGRANFGPQLSLSYDSGASNSSFGLGWHLSIPSITRKTDKGLPQYRDTEESDVFILSGAEDLVRHMENKHGKWEIKSIPPRKVDNKIYEIKQYRPRIEGLFARIELWKNSTDLTDTFWRSISKDNITTWYGKSSESRITDPNNTSHIYSWLICESYDDKGNVIVYEYKDEDAAGINMTQVNEKNRMRDANRHLKRIRYGNNQPYLPVLDAGSPWPMPPGIGNWFFEVILDYGEHDNDAPTPDDGGIWPVRNDPFSSYRSGFEVRTYRLCQRILMFHHFPEEAEIGANCLVRSTDFTYNYENNPADVRNPIFSFMLSVTQTGYKRKVTGGYLSKSLPPLEFSYTEATIDKSVHEVNLDSLENLPIGLDSDGYQWIDLDGEGISGILSKPANGWFYKRNLSPLPVRDNGTEHFEARFTPVELVATKPMLSLSARHAQFMDLAGDGQPALVTFDKDPGFFERTCDADWEPFRSFRSWPNLDTRDPNLKFVDLNGDGHADILISEDEVFRWYPSLAEDGFGPSELVHKPYDEETGPALVFADGTQSIYLADLSGDGLSDLVRVRNGEVCYWPNLGYGRFGAKVTMDNSPVFDTPDLFDQKRIRLADIDGSGTTDIIYLHGDGVRIYFNQAGNSWSQPEVLACFPQTNNLTSITVVDLLGNGTACLVWSSPLPGDRHPLRYLDLMGGQKPHLLISAVNKLGAETIVSYAPSTKFYLQDKLFGNPWITKLPFPVHVVERVKTYDRISRNCFVTSFAYHHGYFDGVEREFRGFGMVEQWDTEEFAALSGSLAFPDATNIEKSSHVPPVLTKTWFHTGAYLQGSQISKHFEGEYYREGDLSQGMPGMIDEQLRAMELPDTVSPETVFLSNGNRTTFIFSADEEREACRALKGSVLRQEVYALDRRPDGSLTEESDRPYRVSERNYTIECLQPQSGNPHSVFFCHPRETVDFHYERKLYDVGGRKLADPRVSHSMTLAVDAYGNALKSVAIGYGRRIDDPDPTLTDQDRLEQKRILISSTENDFTNPVLDDDAYRTPLPSEARTYEIVNTKPDSTLPAITNLFRFKELMSKLQIANDGNHEILYEDLNASQAVDDCPYQRLIERVRMLYRKDDLTSLLPTGQLQSLSLPGESFKLAFTPGLLATVFRRKQQDGSWEDLLPDPNFVLGQGGAEGGGYVDLDGSNHWWISSGRVFYSPDTDDGAATELAYARQHFFLPHRYRDPFFSDQFRTETRVSFDQYNLLMQETQDALGNIVTAGERDEAGALMKSRNDYRVLQPTMVMDPNRNRSAVVFDVLGMVAGSAVMGKEQEPDGKPQGDLLDEQFVADLTKKQIDDFFANPLDQAAGLLGTATTRIIYDLDLFKRTWEQNPDDPDKWQPVFAATLARETHVSDLAPTEQTKIQISFSYSDGFGREIQKKIQAEPGNVEVEDSTGTINTVDTTPNIRWVSSGWTIFNNKGKPVRQYEPFFSTDHQFQYGMKVGVSPVLFYDPAERVIATLHPNNTFEKVVFDPWYQAIWDVNDTVLLDPRTDPDISAYTAKYFANQPATWKSWLQERLTDSQNLPADSHGKTPEQDAAVRTITHANTPVIAFFDSLGRSFLTVADNGPDQNATPRKYCTRIKFDIENNQREVVDAKDRVVMRYDYDMLGNRIHQASMEAGERWTLSDVAGKHIHSWDSRLHQFRTIYDQLRRPTASCLLEGVGPELVVGRTTYGESRPNPETGNLRGKVYYNYDQAGVLTTDDYDFKSNLLSSNRQLAIEYKNTLDWSKTVSLEADIYSIRTTYDALNRPMTLTTPDMSIIRPSYNEANLLEKIEASLYGAISITPFVTNIDYNAKGQRTLIEYGILDGSGNSRVRTEYLYDSNTFRLTQILTTRNASDQLQALNYFYDPAGNITYIRDDAQQTIYFDNKRVEPSCDYVYDAIYRLIEARGREHLGQTAGHLNAPTASDAFNLYHAGMQQPGDGKAMGAYIEQYVYDAVGNFLSMQHRGSDSSNPGWIRTYAYGEENQLESGKKNNRLSSTKIGQTTENYRYDGNEGLHGNITFMPHLPVMRWDYHDQLQATAQQVVDNGGIPETTWYVYDSGGQRVRKLTESTVTAAGASAGKKPVRVKERIYLGGFEIYREYGADGGKTLERESLHIMDDKRRVALVETKTNESGFLSGLKQLFTTPETLLRYQFHNHLGSACLELNDEAVVISYEEFYPYGSTSYQSVNRNIKAAAKRYRFTGKELDEESGLYFHGARYYATWVGRWASADPAGLIDGLNLFVMARNSPVRFHDPTGKSGEETSVVRPLVEGALNQKGLNYAREVSFDVLNKAGKTITSGRFDLVFLDPRTGKPVIPELKGADLEALTKNQQIYKPMLESAEGAQIRITGSKASSLGLTKGTTLVVSGENYLVVGMENSQEFRVALDEVAGGGKIKHTFLDRSGKAHMFKTTEEFKAFLKQTGRTEPKPPSGVRGPGGPRGFMTLEALGLAFGVAVAATQYSRGGMEIAKGKTAEGTISTAEGSATLFMTFAPYAKGVTSATGTGAGLLTAGAFTAAAGGVTLLAETARSAVRGEKTPIEVADEYYGSHLSDITKIPAQFKQLWNGF